VALEGTSTIVVVDPRSRPIVQPTSAPRLDRLDGMTIGYLWNNRPRGDRVLFGLARLLEQTHGTRSVCTNKLRVGTGATEDEIRRLEKEVQAVIVGVGD
jgi:hypothetical protein